MSVGLYVHTSRSIGTILTADIYNVDHQAHVNGNIPTLTGAYSDTLVQMKLTIDPYPGNVESLAVDLAGEITRLRYVIKSLKQSLLGAGFIFWYSTITPASSPFAVHDARTVRTTTQTIPLKTATPIIFDSTRRDTDSFWSIANPTRLTAPFTGIYNIGANVQWDTTNFNQPIVVFIRHQDGSIIALQQRTPINTTVRPMILNGEWRLVAGDYVEICAVQGMTATMDVQAAPNYSIEAWISLIGRSF